MIRRNGLCVIKFTFGDSWTIDGSRSEEEYAAMTWPCWLTPEQQTPERPNREDPEFPLVLAYLWMRLLAGALGVALPFVLVFGDRLFVDGSPFARSSLSAYYHSGVGDLFVGILTVIGLFLATYKLPHCNLDRSLGIATGIVALGVAYFSIDGAPGETPLQNLLSISVVKWIHITSAAAFFGLLAILSFLFGYREGRRDDSKGVFRWSPSKMVRRWFHWGCALVIVGAMVYIGATDLLDVPGGHHALFGETIAIFAFGASWVYKGAELDIIWPWLYKRLC